MSSVKPNLPCKTTTSRVLRLPKNEHGRDYIVGDIHGAYDLVWRAMQAVKFNPLVDRLLSVGDLIDRGAGSARCLKFIQQPYVFAVAGNHERMLVEAWKDGHLQRDVIDALANMDFNGMRWMKDVSIEYLIEIAQAMDRLPFAIDIETGRGHVGIVHADVPQEMDWSSFLEAIEAGDSYASNMALGMDMDDRIPASRQRILTGRKDGVKGVGRVFMGHTTLFGGLQYLGNCVACDSGAAFSESGKGKGHLTFVDPLMATGYLCENQRRQDPLLDLRVHGEVPNYPFSYVD